MDDTTRHRIRNQLDMNDELIPKPPCTTQSPPPRRVRKDTTESRERAPHPTAHHAPHRATPPNHPPPPHLIPPARSQKKLSNAGSAMRQEKTFTSHIVERASGDERPRRMMEKQTRSRSTIRLNVRRRGRRRSSQGMIW